MRGWGDCDNACEGSKRAEKVSAPDLKRTQLTRRLGEVQGAVVRELASDGRLLLKQWLDRVDFQLWRLSK